MKREPLNQDSVREFIVAAHGNFDEVKKLLAAEPALLHSSINWGGDDWESALGAAAHTGRRDIAQFLLDRGARMDIFAAAMLGELPIIQAMLSACPSLLHAKGAHGIPLLRHAKMGGEPAFPVYEYIDKLLSEEAVL